MEPAAKRKNDTFQFFSFLQCSRTTNTATRHSKSRSADSGISTGGSEAALRNNKNNHNNNSEVLLISDDEDTMDASESEFEFELLCEVEFETGQPLPLPIEQKLICKVEPERIQEGSYVPPTTNATMNTTTNVTTAATPQNKQPLNSSAANLDVTLDQANLSECEEELLSLIKLEPNCNLNGSGAAASPAKSAGGGGGAGNNYFIYICPQCGAAFETSSSWSEHIDREHQLSDQRQFNFTQRPNNKFECNKCRAIITRCTLKTLQQHRFTHLPHKAYKCKLCRFEARSLYMMISHIMLHKEREELGDATICATTSKTAAAQKQVELEHESRLLIAYVCPACGISFDAEDAWQAHINFRHNFLEKTAENRFEDHFKCSECGVEIFSQHVADLQQHLFTHLPFKSFLKCKLCNWTISRPRPAAKPSTTLGRLFDYDNELENDGLSPDVSFIAEEPTVTLPRRSNLNVSTSYNANDSITSENSNTTQNTSTTSVTSAPTATAELRSGYACAGCNRHFPTSVERNAHNLAAHAKYNCKECHQNFALKVELKRHVCKNKKGMKCEVCLKEYNYEKSFMKHIKRCRTYIQRGRSYSDSD